MTEPESTTTELIDEWTDVSPAELQLVEDLQQWFISRPSQADIELYTTAIADASYPTVVDATTRIIMKAWKRFVAAHREVLVASTLPALNCIAVLSKADSEPLPVHDGISVELVEAVYQLRAQAEPFLSYYHAGKMVIAQCRYTELIPYVSTLASLRPDLLQRLEVELLNSFYSSPQSSESILQYLRELHTAEIVPNEFIEGNPLRNPLVIAFIESINDVYKLLVEAKRRNPALTSQELLKLQQASCISDVVEELGEQFDAALGFFTTDDATLAAHAWLTQLLHTDKVNTGEARTAIVAYLATMNTEQITFFLDLFFSTLDRSETILELAEGLPIASMARAVVVHNQTEAMWSAILEELLPNVEQDEQDFVRTYCREILQTVMMIREKLQ
jgi:hypothetical protein